MEPASALREAAENLIKSLVISPTPTRWRS